MPWIPLLARPRELLPASYPNPGNKDDMHCHNADQTFYVIEGECTMRFPDGGKAVMNPGMAALITGLMGNRSGPSEDIQHINYELRKDIKTLTLEERNQIRQGAVHMPEALPPPRVLLPLNSAMELPPRRCNAVSYAAERKL